VVSGQTTVFVNGQLWAVQGDQNTHGGGSLIPSGSTVKVQGIPVIVHSPDSANPDNADHTNPATAGGSGTVNAY
jgi:uncharacterized Zn-binding protein involved in type VI secretion